VLQEQQLKIEEVAARLGYHDPYYFSRLFKQVIGQAPSAYRRTPVNSASNCSGPVVARLAPARQPEPAAFD
jgi:AraC-like DNA-binding protein